MSGAFSQKELKGLIDAFNAIPEYRKNILNTHHKLVDIIVIAVCGVIAGADGAASKNVSHVVEEETSHGRVERREYFQVTLPEDFGEAKRWPGAKTIGMVTRTHRKTKVQPSQRDRSKPVPRTRPCQGHANHPGNRIAAAPLPSEECPMQPNFQDMKNACLFPGLPGI